MNQKYLFYSIGYFCTLFIYALIIWFGAQWAAVDKFSVFYMTPPSSPKESIWNPIILGGAMLAGIFSALLIEAIKATNSGLNNIRQLLSYLLSSPTVLLALLFSPILFFTVYKVSSGAVDNLSAYLFAFQNGFFWESVFSTTTPSPRRRK
ncbi:hypothetical protein [Candidatus Methylobacter oryzae]|uniref:ABC transmembrane type-1 domain-containing protein n=1 Tax=Candidatus Methylobacter oryzae TaxID=2497749 RepID=A0ABY3CB23_9GAMM|nr:hypothetical protein [Candidatus Methylobacter oryzae]TRW95616.1 hypothetical protein EKO24_009810 [Candidatus Methylobacter oryzae]